MRIIKCDYCKSEINEGVEHVELSVKISDGVCICAFKTFDLHTECKHSSLDKIKHAVQTALTNG